MKSYKNFSLLIILITLVSSCSTAQKLQTNAPTVLGEVYYQKWVSGVKGGGSGLNLFIPLQKELPKDIKLDSVYFRGQGTSLEKTQDGKMLYIGRFKTDFNQKQDIIMSEDSKEEYGNTLTIKHSKSPFDLKENECVVSYKSESKTYYFKIGDISEKQTQNYPSAPRNN